MHQPKLRELRAAFNQLAHALGKQTGKDPGQWDIEFTGGGWRVVSLDHNKNPIIH